MKKKSRGEKTYHTQSQWEKILWKQDLSWMWCLQCHLMACSETASAPVSQEMLTSPWGSAAAQLGAVWQPWWRLKELTTTQVRCVMDSTLPLRYFSMLKCFVFCLFFFGGGVLFCFLFIWLIDYHHFLTKKPRDRESSHRELEWPQYRVTGICTLRPIEDLPTTWTAQRSSSHGSPFKQAVGRGWGKTPYNKISQNSNQETWNPSIHSQLLSCSIVHVQFWNCGADCLLSLLKNVPLSTLQLSKYINCRESPA